VRWNDEYELRTAAEEKRKTIEFYAKERNFRLIDGVHILLCACTTITTMLVDRMSG
jgi:hypothetical protein